MQRAMNQTNDRAASADGGGGRGSEAHAAENEKLREELLIANQAAAQRAVELEQANNDLRREAQARTDAENKLRHAQRMESIGQLAAGVAHDFNNVLTVIHGHASMLSMRLGQEGPHAKSIREIRLAAERAANLVRQLLQFSRKQIMQFRNVDLADVLRSISGMLRQLVGEHIDVETECAPDLPPIYADRGMIEQVIVNLTINARDAMPRGGKVILKIAGLELDRDGAARHTDAFAGRFVSLTVSDSGCGMDTVAMAHIFEAFFTTKEPGKGTGLGLATVYGIVKQHQGWIEVRSEAGAGSTFEIFFPVSTEAVQMVSEGNIEPAPQHGSETILLAEDEAALRDMVAEILTLRGYKVLAAGSGPAALDLARSISGPIHLLLTDMVMPGGMMGTDLASSVKRDHPNLKIIYTTGYTSGSAGLHEGVNLISKPYSPTKLTEVVRHCLDT
jgi:signal transduction histidine kinase